MNKNLIEFWTKQDRDDKLIHLVGTTLQEVIEKDSVRDIYTDDWSYHFWYGLISRFPLCCVLFFCDVWLDLRKKKTMFSYKKSKDWKWGLGYVPCPVCAVNCFCERNPELEWKWKKRNGDWVKIEKEPVK